MQAIYQRLHTALSRFSSFLDKKREIKTKIRHVKETASKQADTVQMDAIRSYIDTLDT